MGVAFLRHPVCISELASLETWAEELGSFCSRDIHVFCVQQRSICSLLVAHFECIFNRNFREQDPFMHTSLGP